MSTKCCSMFTFVSRLMWVIFMILQLLVILFFLDDDGYSSTKTLVYAGKNKDEHLFLHMPEGGSKIILPIPLFIPFPFPIIEDIEKIYHKKKVLIITYPKTEYKKPKHDLKKIKYESYGQNFSTYYEPHYNANYDSYDHGPYDSKYYDHKHYDSTYDDHHYNSYYDHNYDSKYGSSSSYESSSSSYGSSPSKYSSSSYESLRSKYGSSPSKYSSSSYESSSSKYNSNHDYEHSSSEAVQSIYGSHGTEIIDLKDLPHDSIKDLYGKKKKPKKTTKKTTLISPSIEFDSPTKFFPYDADEGEEVEHVEYSSDDGKSQDLNPRNIINTLRKLLTKENVKLKVNIDYNKDKLKHEKKKPERERTRSIGKVIDEQIKKLEDEEHDNH